jgi:nicotinamide-nucleotide amidase
MNLSIIIIGDEILLGQVNDTNSGFIARNLAVQGWKTVGIETVGDNGDDIRAAICRAMAKSDLIITTGGLGPTKDDITKPIMLEIFGGEMYRNAEVTANIERVFKLRGLKMNTLTADQALVPSSCRVIQNRLGTAPIMWFERDGKVLVTMPGVPFETEGMLVDAVIPAINARFNSDIIQFHHTLMVAGITESNLALHLTDFEDSLAEGLHLAYLPKPGLIRLRLDGIAKADDLAFEAKYNAALDRLRSTLGDLMIYDGDATPAEIALHLLRERGMTLATAESCTGGNIAHEITLIAGSSDVFNGSVVSYSNAAKRDALGVKAATLDAHGAVSEPTVIEMAEGARRALHADFAVATSGIAGPGGGTPDKPVGTVWTAVATPKGTVTRLLHLPGNRQRVINRTTTEVLLDLIAQIRK